MYDRGKEFLGHEWNNDQIEKEYGIKAKCATTENPQVNYILEIIHEVVANLVRTFDLQNNYLDEDDPWSGILAATAFTVQIIYHPTLQATLGQMVLGRDVILNTPFIVDWEAIRPQTQKIRDKNNRLKKNRKLYTYRIQDKVWVCKKIKVYCRPLSDNSSMDKWKRHNLLGHRTRTKKH